MSVVRPPRGPLLPFVRLVWFSAAAATHALERVLPTGAMHVVVRLDDVPLRLVGPAGPTSVGPAIVGGARSSAWPISSVVRESGYSHRRVSSVFREAVGLAPRVFCRVQRFQRAVAAITAGRPLAAVAHGCGYADQAHLTREFRDIAGLTPAAYRAASPAQTNHVPISDSFKTAAPRRRRLGT